MDILHVILSDAWELPSSQQWVEILTYLNAFDYSSQMCGQDNILRDCYKFFLLAAKLFGFEAEFKLKLNIDTQGLTKGSVDVSAIGDETMQAISQGSALKVSNTKGRSSDSTPLREKSSPLSSQRLESHLRQVNHRFTLTDNVTLNLNSVSHLERISNMGMTSDNELERSKQHHLSSSPDAVCKQMFRQTQGQLGGTRAKCAKEMKKTNMQADIEKARNVRRFQWFTDESGKKEAGEYEAQELN